MAIMPKMVLPDESDWSETLEAARQCLGSGPKGIIVAYLRQNPGSYRSEIAEGTALKAATLQNHIDDLVESGIVDSDIPLAKRGRGRASRYTVNRDRVIQLLDAMKEFLLGQD